MRLLEVTDVDFGNTDDVLEAHGLDTPAPRQSTGFFGFDLRGWALGRESPAESVALRQEGGELRAIAVAGERPDVAEQFPQSTWSGTSGYFTPVGALRLAPSFELEVGVRLVDGTGARLGTISGRRPVLDTAFEPSIEPICLTALGRTGSTAVARLLSAHPLIAAYRPFEYEPRIVTYWIDLLKDLSEPASFRRQIAPNGPLADNWWVGAREPFPRRLVDEDVQGWIGGENVEELARFCQARIDGLYRRIAERFDRPGAAYFVEKLGPDTGALVHELYPHAREVFLVRDFRDVVASILAFNEKRGFQGFSRSGASSDSEYVSYWMSDSAGSFLRAWRARASCAYLMRYEDLVRQPRETLVGLLDHLVLDAPAATVDAMLGTLDEPASETHRTTGAEESIGRWRRDLPDDVKEACERAFGEALQQFGYTD
jgi:hypothetical protein